jgi:hypothetical protein
VSATPQPPVYFLPPGSIGGDNINRLHRLLKALGRRYGLRCVSIKQERRLNSDNLSGTAARVSP